jgi:hypothetical protein
MMMKAKRRQQLDIYLTEAFLIKLTPGVTGCHKIRRSSWYYKPRNFEADTEKHAEIQRHLDHRQLRNVHEIATKNLREQESME